MDIKWIEKDEQIKQRYDQAKTENKIFAEKFPIIEKFYEAISDKYPKQEQQNSGGTTA